MSAYRTKTVVLTPHEREAMLRLIENARGFASILGNTKNVRSPSPSRIDTDHATKLRVWAQAVEDVLLRSEATP